MPCYQPYKAWRSETGTVVLGKEPVASTATLGLPCGSCIGCRKRQAKEWALRCHLEMQQHETATFTTLTYETAPPTLNKRHLSDFIRSLRKRTKKPLRFFASGEYGEQNKRPHYHGILYGLHHTEEDKINSSWDKGYTQNVPVTPEAIAYVAGYTAKKWGEPKYRNPHDEPPKLDPTGTYFYRVQPPFIQMSRKPGIGGNSRDHTESWRSYAILNGHKMAVPRYLHEAWKDKATPQEIEQLQQEKTKINNENQLTEYQLDAMYKMAVAQHNERARKRKL